MDADRDVNGGRMTLLWLFFYFTLYYFIILLLYYHIIILSYYTIVILYISYLNYAFECEHLTIKKSKGYLISWFIYQIIRLLV